MELQARRVSVAVVAAAVVVLASAAQAVPRNPDSTLPAAQAAAQRSDAGYRVGYSSSPRSGLWRLWLVNADGSSRRRRVPVRSRDGGFDASPNGRLIAFARSRNGIYTMRPDGTNKRRVVASVRWRGEETTSLGAPSWSPDGRELAFVADFKESFLMGIFIARVDGSRRIRPLFAPADGYVGPPDWSKTNMIAFYEDFALWAIRSDGTERRRLGRFGDEGHSWSPSGRRLVVAGAGLSVIDLGDGSRRRLVDCGRHPTWAPVGERIAFSTFACGPEVRAEIWVIRADGSGRRRLTNDRVPDLAPFWVKGTW